jgi:hypothetical protein
MGEVRFTFKKDEVKSWYEDKRTNLEQQVSYLVESILNILELVAGVLAPFRSGELRFSHLVELGGLEGIMYPSAFHAIFVILGTKAHPIDPLRPAYALWWPGAFHPVSHVEHPGTRPNDYINDVIPSSQAGIDKVNKELLDWLVT